MSHFCTNQRGHILVVTLMLTSLTLVLATMFTQLVQTDVQMRGGVIRGQAGFYAAEAGLNTRMAGLFTIFDAHTACPRAQTLTNRSSALITGQSIHGLRPLMDRAVTLEISIA